MTFKKSLLIVGALSVMTFSASQPLSAQAIEPLLDMKARSVPVQGNTYILVTVTNRGTQILDQINFKCVFTLGGDAVSVVTGHVQRLGPGKSDTVQLYTNYQTPSDDYACRATQALIYF